MNPIGALQEYCQRGNRSMPKYDLVSHVVSPNSNNFTIRVTCDGLRAEGTDLNKKAAKAKAATNMIELLKRQGHEVFSTVNSRNTPDKISVDININRPDSNAERLSSNDCVSSTYPIFINSVGKLQELCVKHHYGAPRYECADNFLAGGHKMVCILQDMREEAIGQNKKIAKQLCAELMWKRVINLLGNNLTLNISAEKPAINPVDHVIKKFDDLCIDLVTVPKCTDRAKDIYSKSSHIKPVDNIKKVHVADYHLYYKSTLSPQTLTNINNYYSGSTLIIGDLRNLMKNFNEICSMLKVDHEIQFLPSIISDIHIASCKLKIIPHLTQIGIGKTSEDAQSNVILLTIESLKKLLLN